MNYTYPFYSPIIIEVKKAAGNFPLILSIINRHYNGSHTSKSDKRDNLHLAR